MFDLKSLYPMIYKRKSVRAFDDKNPLGAEELDEIRQAAAELKPLCPEIRTSISLLDHKETNCRRGAYCLLFYSEKCEHALLNAGYMMEQMDLYLESKGIGVCWYGFGKAQQPKLDGLTFVIMLNIGRLKPNSLRKSLEDAKRKPESEVWRGEAKPEILKLARFAPSSCNMQPWRVSADADGFTVYRSTDVHSPIMPPSFRPFFNTIDMGIFLCFLDILLEEQGVSYQCELSPDMLDPKQKGEFEVCRYHCKEQ